MEYLDFQRDLKKLLCDTIFSSSNDSIHEFSVDHVTIIKRNKELSKGDFVIIAKEMDNAGPEKQTLSSQMVSLSIFFFYLSRRVVGERPVRLLHG